MCKKHETEVYYEIMKQEFHLVLIICDVMLILQS